MRRESVNYTVVGFFVLSTLAGALYFLYLVVGRQGPMDPYFVVYENVAGVKRGTPVLFEGFQVGEVESIEPRWREGQLEYRVRLGVRQGWPVPSDSVAHLKASGLLAAVAVDIEAGTGGELAPPGSTLEGRAQVDLFTAVNDAANDFRALSREGLRPLVRRLDEGATALMADLRALVNEELRPAARSVRRELEDPALFGSARAALGSLEAVSRRVSALLDEQTVLAMRELFRDAALLAVELRETNRALRVLVGPETSARVQQTLDRIDATAGTLGEAIEVTTTHLQELLGGENRERLARTLEHLDALAADLASAASGAREMLGEENVSRWSRSLANGEALTGDLVESSGRLREMLSEANTRRYEALLANVDAFVTELRESNERFQALLDEDNRRNLASLLATGAQLGRDVRSATSALGSVLNAETAARVQGFLRAMEGTAVEVNGLARSLQGTRKRLDALIADARAVVAENRGPAHEAVSSLRRSLAVVEEHIGTIAYHLESSSRNMQEFTRQIRENPGLLISGRPQPVRAE